MQEIQTNLSILKKSTALGTTQPDENTTTKDEALCSSESRDTCQPIIENPGKQNKGEIDLYAVSEIKGENERLYKMIENIQREKDELQARYEELLSTCKEPVLLLTIKT